MSFQIRNITSVQHPLYAADGDSCHIPPQRTVTVHDKFRDFQVDPTKFRVVTPRQLQAAAAQTAALNAAEAESAASQAANQAQPQSYGDPVE